MIKAIKILSNRIEILNSEFKKEEKNSDEPEMLSDYHFALSNMANIELEIIELQKAIDVLHKYKPMICPECQEVQCDDDCSNKENR